MNRKLKVKLLDIDAKLPTRSYEYDAGLDLYSNQTVYVKSHETFKINTGIAVEIPPHYFGSIRERSGLAANGIKISGGVVDSQYRGEIGVLIYNTTPYSILIRKFDKIAQLIIQPCELLDVECVNELSTTKRNDNGFGSSDGT